MYSLNWHRSFDVRKLVDARRRSVWMLPIFNISLLGCVTRANALGVNGALDTSRRRRHIKKNLIK